MDTYRSDGGKDGRLEQIVIHASRDQALHLRLEPFSMLIIGILVFGVELHMDHFVQKRDLRELMKTGDALGDLDLLALASLQDAWAEIVRVWWEIASVSEHQNRRISRRVAD